MFINLDFVNRSCTILPAKLFSPFFMTKSVGYIRVSTDKQDFERQRDEITEYAKRNDFEIVRFFEDKHTGSDYKDRKVFRSFCNTSMTTRISGDYFR